MTDDGWTCRPLPAGVDCSGVFAGRDGVSPSVAQKLMRHSDIRLTMNTYTHLDLADTADTESALTSYHRQLQTRLFKHSNNLGEKE